MIRVGFDVTALLAGNTGVARYVRELDRAFAEHDVELIRFAIGRGERRDKIPPETRWVRVPLRLIHRMWSFSGVPSAEWLAPGCDVVHIPDLVPPPTRRPLVVTVHDLVALEHPELQPPKFAAVQRIQLAAAHDRAAIVLSDSRATADALCHRGVDPARIIVAPIGVTTLPAPDRSIVPPHPYLLFVGSLIPRKGVDALVAAFARADISDAVRLVLAGSPAWGTSAILAAAERYGVSERVIRTGRVSDAQLAALYESTLAVCVPSIAEGFGLPILEAAAAGAAVVASDIPVFREVEGAVALYAPPCDRHAWAGALERIVGDEELRTSTAKGARAFAGQYTWERTAALTVAAYERAREAAGADA